MNTQISRTKRPWSWKAFFVLIGLNILAVVAYKVYRSAVPSASTSSNWTSYIVLVVEYIACITIGLVLANRISLGLPFVGGWGEREPVRVSFRKVLAIAWLAGVSLAVVMMVLSLVVFEPSMQAMFQEFGITTPSAAKISPLYGFLTSFYAGVTEETLCRLAALTLVAWLGGLLFHRPDGRPKLGILWLANILTALLFGFGHLQIAAGLGWPMSPLVITRTLLLNAIGGLAFGWLYWKYGFESAMLAHFFADVILQVVYPFVTMWQAEAARMAAFAGAAVVILLSFILAGRVLSASKIKESQAGALKPA